MPEMSHVREYSEIKVHERRAGVVRRTLVSGVSLTTIEIQLDEGTVVEHEHPHEEAGQVQSGRIAVRVGDDPERELAAGDVYYMPGGVPHRVRVLERARMVEAFSPRREDLAD